jgi:hypothetical protein
VERDDRFIAAVAARTGRVDCNTLASRNATDAAVAARTGGVD